MTTILTGILRDIFQTETITDRFQKRDFWIEQTGTERPQVWECELQQSDVTEIDKYLPGEELEVTVEVRGRIANTKKGEQVFHSLKVIGIRRNSGKASPFKEPLPDAYKSPAPGERFTSRRPSNFSNSRRTF